MANPLLRYWHKLYIDQTPCEQIVEKYVATLGVRYRTQHPFMAQKAFADFYFPDHNLVLEIDDPGHLRKSRQKKDLERTKRLQALGLTIVRVTNETILSKSQITQAKWKNRLRRDLGLDAPPTHVPPAKDTACQQPTPSPKRRGKTAYRR